MKLFDLVLRSKEHALLPAEVNEAGTVGLLL